MRQMAKNQTEIELKNCDSRARACLRGDRRNKKANVTVDPARLGTYINVEPVDWAVGMRFLLPKPRLEY